MNPDSVALAGAIAIFATSAFLQAALCGIPRRLAIRIVAFAARWRGNRMKPIISCAVAATLPNNREGNAS